LDVKKRFSEEQIIGFLREAEAGLPVKELCRKHGFSEASYYLWRSKFGGMSVPDAKRLKELETENGRLKKLLAEQVLENEVIKRGRCEKSGERTGATRAGAATWSTKGLSERRALAVVCMSASAYRYEPASLIGTSSCACPISLGYGWNPVATSAAPRHKFWAGYRERRIREVCEASLGHHRGVGESDKQARWQAPKMPASPRSAVR
jgi:hypothetical protein